MRQRNPRPAPRSAQIAEAIAEVRAVFDALDQRPVESDCQRRTGCCHFKLTGEVPSLTHAEALLMLKAWRASGRKQIPEPADGACPMFDAQTSSCRIYEARPFGCRTHFCAAAGGPYARRAVIDLIRRLEIASEKLGVRDPRPLGAALARASAGGN